ncbi:magnesium transporter [Bacteroides coprosuis DSM 18011]|uniref:Magnesium transporter MgtE n=1 Tax=Bacteroides coprosuis DSM 18011 TaxID=679937 RepID=F3ZSQ0_9BACE|nr:MULTISPECIES: magnesium transporter [Bacteroides]EGJ70924.1 magnesium transporter [Bacteroides coprosuis DSM 18011]HJD91091.1 magnesium transporter [Bacteroides coprosuis]
MNQEFIDHIKALIKNKAQSQLKDELQKLHPADIAELLNDLSYTEAKDIYRLLDNEIAADVLVEMDEDIRKDFLELLPSATIAKRFIDHMDTDDAVDLMRDLDTEKQSEILSHIDDVEQAGNIVDLLKYDEHTAGGLMATEMVKVNENLSMPECLKEMRAQAEELDEIHYVYVVDDDDRLQGVFPLKKVITSPSVSKVKHVMKKDPISVKVDTPLDEVAQIIEKYDLVALPVVDSIGRLAGIITVDDVMDEIREQAEKDYQLASGLSQDVETDDNLFKQTKARLPWLLIGMIGGMGNSILIEGFESTLTTEMSYYIPLIGGTGGNVGTQSSALVVQGLANSSLDSKETVKQVSKEAVVALVNATIISMLVYIFNFFRFGPTAIITYSVSLSLFSVVMFASIFGTLVPMTLERLKIDPAIATGPFISITNDIVGMMFYMMLTRLLS